MIGLVTGVPGASTDIRELMIARGLGWVVPYAMGRIYFGRGDGPGRVAVALTIAGLCYIPVCLYEEAAGPSRYLAGLIYRIPSNPNMVDRLGGWRPEGFLPDGLSVAAWMALTTVTATWVWLGGWRAGRWPTWATALALGLATLSCRGVYGYLLMAIGLAATMLTRGLRTRIVLIALMALPVVYIGLRAAGAWDGQALVRASSFTGRSGTVDFRLKAEDELIHRVLAEHPFFGFGNYVWNAGLPRWPDGGWVQALWMGGLVGLSLQLLALHVLPAALALRRPPGRPDARQAAAPSWALGCWCLLQMIDSLHNASYFPMTSLIAGTLIGSSSSKGSDAFEARSMAGSRVVGRRSGPAPVALIVTVIFLVGIEVLGRWRAPEPPNLRPPALEAAERNPHP